MATATMNALINAQSATRSADAWARGEDAMSRSPFLA
jgi:hypothetical protein